MDENQPGPAAAVKREYAAKTALSLVFVAGLVLFVVFSGPVYLLQTVQSWSAFDFVLLGLATYRLGRLVAYDRVMEPFRQFAARTVPDSTGAGESVEPKASGAMGAIGQLITCPICSGTWIAALLVFALVWLPGAARIFLWMTAAIGLAEVINALTEALCWKGQHARARAGEINRLRLSQGEEGDREDGAKGQA